MGRFAIHLAWGFYRDAEDINGMRNCHEVLKDYSAFAKNKVLLETCFEKMRSWRDIIEADDISKILLNSAAGIKLFKARLKPEVLQTLENAVAYLEPE